MHYLSGPFLRSLPIAFYIRKDSAILLKRYEDLYRCKSVGVLNKASYFRHFGQNEQIAKIPVTSQDQHFPMLANGRVEVIAGYVDTENYRLTLEGYRDKVIQRELLKNGFIRNVIWKYKMRYE